MGAGMKKEDLIQEKQLLGYYVVNDAGNKIEFSDGSTYAKDFRTGLYRQVKTFVL